MWVAPMNADCLLRCNRDDCLNPPSLTERFAVSAKEQARADGNRRCPHGMLRSAKCVVPTCEFWDGFRDSDNARLKLRGYRTTQRKREMG